MNTLKLALTSCGNPDFNQNPDQSFYGAPEDSMVSVDSFEDARSKCWSFIADHDLGGGNWSGGDIFDKGVLVARISYNCRIWLADGSEYSSA